MVGQDAEKKTTNRANRRESIREDSRDSSFFSYFADRLRQPRGETPREARRRTRRNATRRREGSRSPALAQILLDLTDYAVTIFRNNHDVVPTVPFGI